MFRRVQQNQQNEPIFFLKWSIFPVRYVFCVLVWIEWESPLSLFIYILNSVPALWESEDNISVSTRSQQHLKAVMCDSSPFTQVEMVLWEVIRVAVCLLCKDHLVACWLSPFQIVRLSCKQLLQTSKPGKCDGVGLRQASESQRSTFHTLIIFKQRVHVNTVRRSFVHIINNSCSEMF